jgi:nicotinamide-nucleotide amidase
MNVDIILIDRDIINNDIFKKYILRHLKTKVDYINNIISLNDYYKIDIFDILSKQQSSHIYIFTSLSTFNLLGKQISSKLQCDTIIKDDTFIPEISTCSTHSSYVIELFDKQINIIVADNKKQLPKLLLENNISKKSFNVFGFDNTQLKIILDSIASVHNISYQICQIVPQWQKVYIISSFADISNFIKASKELLSHQIIDKDDVIPHIIEQFDNNNKYITFAESCTGGLVSSYFTKYPNISDIFELGIISYANDVKNELLNVNLDNLFKNGAVSHSVVQDMINGALEKSKADYAIAISGIAGPSGGNDSKPVGCVYIGIGDKNTQNIQRYDFNGDRVYIQEQALMNAIKMLILFAKNDLF